MNEDDLQNLYGGTLTATDYEAEPPEIPTGDEASANWHLLCYLAARGEREAVTARFEAEISRLRARLAERVEIHERQMEWHERAVSSWHRARVREGGASTVHLPAGVSKVTTGRAKIVEPAEGELRDAFRSWLAEREDDDGVPFERRVYRRTESFMVSELGKLGLKPAIPRKRPEPGTLVSVVDEDGVEVPGVKAVIEESSWKGAEG